MFEIISGVFTENTAKSGGAIEILILAMRDHHLMSSIVLLLETVPASQEWWSFVCVGYIIIH